MGLRFRQPKPIAISVRPPLRYTPVSELAALELPVPSMRRFAPIFTAAATVVLIGRTHLPGNAATCGSLWGHG
jgi:hypothetical protein